MDFSRVDVQRRLDTISRTIREEGGAAPKHVIDQILDRLERAAMKLESQGGRVVFVHLPHDGPVKMLEDQIYPRERYWDRLAARFAGAAIHYEDYPSLRSFTCPDGSHLDLRDAPAFTRALAKIVNELPDR